MAQERSQRQHSAWQQSQEHEQEAVGAAKVSRSAGVDDLLDEIDSLLESNAEEFVKGYVQKGGQ